MATRPTTPCWSSLIIGSRPNLMRWAAPSAIWRSACPMSTRRANGWVRPGSRSRVRPARWRMAVRSSPLSKTPTATASSWSSARSRRFVSLVAVLGWSSRDRIARRHMPASGFESRDKGGDLGRPPQRDERTAELPNGGKVAMPIVPAVAAHVNQKGEIKTLRASGCHIGPCPAEGSNYPAQHAGETAPGREIQKDGRVRYSETSRKRAAEIAVHHPFRSVDECRYLALPCLPIGLSPSRTPIMLIEMYDRKPGDPGDLAGEGRLSGTGTAKDEHPPHRDNLHALGRPAPSSRRKRCQRPGRPDGAWATSSPLSKAPTAAAPTWCGAHKDGIGCIREPAPLPRFGMPIYTKCVHPICASKICRDIRCVGKESGALERTLAFCSNFIKIYAPFALFAGMMLREQ